MKITHICHASILVETGGVRVLSDPWWRGPCFGAQWWTYPFPQLSTVEGLPIDYIYVSHGHHDHLHPGTLSTLSKDTKVLVSSALKIAAPIRELGFEVIELDDGQPVLLGHSGVSCCITKTHGGDTLMTLSDGAEVCVNLNDALHSAPATVQRSFIERLKALHPKIDYVFCGYGVASHFPNCYIIPHKNREATAVRRQQYFNRQWARLIAELQPVYGFPFAADVVFLEKDLFWVNEATHNSERPTDVFRALYPHSPVIVKDIAPGFMIENGVVIADILRQPVVASELETLCAAQIVRANAYGKVEQEGVDEVTDLLRENLVACAAYLGSYDGDYRLLIHFRNSDLGIRMEKRGQDVRLAPTRAASGESYDLTYATRLSYLKWALTRPFGHEVLLVGSGGVFEYFQNSQVKTNLHLELIRLIKKATSPPRSRPGIHSRRVHDAKRWIKRALGRMEVDLYDLSAWTAYDERQHDRRASLGAARVRN